jgi:outer membrane protein assembly factor BamB
MFHLFGKAANGGANWSVQVPVRMRALVLAGDTVFVAGRCDPDIPEIRGLQDRRRIAQIVATLPEERLIPTDAQLLAFSARDGKQLASLVLDAPPAFDGLAAADGRLYVSCRDGSIHCLGR